MEQRSTLEQIQLDIESFRISKKENKWIGYRLCPLCNKEIKHFANERFYLIRNIKKLKLKPCNSCSNRGENNPFFGKKHLESTKKKVSKSKKGKNVGINNPMANPINRKKVSQGLKKAYDSGKLDFLKEIQRKGAIQKQSDGRFKTAPISKAEKEIGFLLKKQFTIEPQFPIGSLKYDFFIKELNLLVEYNGNYWHCNPEMYSFDYFHSKKKMTAQQIWDQDNKKTKIAKEKGYKVFTIWEKDFKLNKKQILEKILNYE